MQLWAKRGAGYPPGQIRDHALMAKDLERPKEQSDVLTMLRSAPQTLTALVSGLDEADALKQVGQEWSIAEIVAHLVHGEWAWFTRIRLMATQDEPRMKVFPDSDHIPPLAESLTGYLRNRVEDLDFLEGLTPQGWARSGKHEVWGDIDILWAARHLAAHDAEHLAQISRLRGSSESGRTVSGQDL